MLDELTKDYEKLSEIEMKGVIGGGETIPPPYPPSMTPSGTGETAYGGYFCGGTYFAHISDYSSSTISSSSFRLYMTVVGYVVSTIIDPTHIVAASVYDYVSRSWDDVKIQVANDVMKTTGYNGPVKIEDRMLYSYDSYTHDGITTGGVYGDVEINVYNATTCEKIATYRADYITGSCKRVY